MGFSYMTLTDFQARTLMPAVDVSAVEADTAGFFVTRLTAQTARMHARLRKRYPNLPFAGPPYPEAVLEWLTKIVTWEGYQKRGFDPADETMKDVRDAATQADLEIKEAADGVVGLFDLPVADGSSGSAVGKGTPLVYSETSPYRWTGLQRDAGRQEDDQ